MERIMIQVKNAEKADLLVQFLKGLDFVESVSRTDLPATEASQSADSSNDFFSLAGIWADRDITLETLRQKAWPNLH